MLRLTNARQLLEERFARGEISTAEYQERLTILNNMSAGQVPAHRVVGFGDAVRLEQYRLALNRAAMRKPMKLLV